MKNKLLILLDLAKVLTKEEKGALQPQEKWRKEKRERWKIDFIPARKTALRFGLLIVLSFY